MEKGKDKTKYEITIGLEFHAQLKTKSKMFCRCDNYSRTAAPNTNVCPVCLGFPGTLPVANKKAIEWTISCGMSLNCEIPIQSKFDRKNYFYPDLPKGYQISQYDMPVARNGFLEIGVDGKKKKVGITRVHLEEDAGKLIHPEGADYSLVDLNRAGTPLMEIVTEPEISSVSEARIVARKIRDILQYLDVSDADMEEGNLRCDANISVNRKQKTENREKRKLGTKVEVKNMNSFKAIERALDYEAKRQVKALERGEKIVQETRGWDESKQKTLSQRSKEYAHDYRYFPEPDLPPLENKKEITDSLKRELPELPDQRIERFKKEYGLSDYDVGVLVDEKGLADYYEEIMSELAEKEGGKEQKDIAKKASNWLTSNLAGLLNKEKKKITDCKITAENFAELILLVHEGKIGTSNADKVLAEMFKTGGDPSTIIENKGATQVSDEGVIKKAIEEVIAKNPKAIEDYKKGKEQALKFLVGQVMVRTKGQANPKIVDEMLRKKI